jgi:hypothetical protein
MASLDAVMEKWDGCAAICTICEGCGCGPCSSVGIANGYGLDYRGSNPGGGEVFRTCPDRPWGPPSPLYNWYRVFPGGKQRPGRDADPSSPSSAVVKEG